MKKIALTLVTLVFSVSFTINASAQTDESCTVRESLASVQESPLQTDEHNPGLYAVVGDDYIPLTYTNGTTASSMTNIIGLEIGNRKYKYKEPTSGVTASDTFVMVIDPDKKAITQTMKAYNPFIKTMTPDNILILPLLSDKDKRIYEEGRTFYGINFNVKDRMDFEWEQITDNSFVIRVQNLIPGEYGFVFRAARLGEFNYAAIFGFTYAEQTDQSIQTD